jgi:hypothetical protein
MLIDAHSHIDRYDLLGEGAREADGAHNTVSVRDETTEASKKRPGGMR